MELMVSIIILILIMVPLMNNFVRAVKINDKADKIQAYSNAASNVIEDMKAKKLNDFITQYNAKLLILNPATGNYSETPSPSDPDNTIYRIDMPGNAYDAILTIDWQNYDYDGTQHEYNNGSETQQTLMNNFQMPDFATMDDSVNGMLFAKLYQANISKANETVSKPDNTSLDKLALADFTAAAEAYATQQLHQTTEYINYLNEMKDWATKRQEAVLNGTALPAVPSEPTIHQPAYSYCEASEIEKLITKNMNITVSTETDKTKISYDLTYACAWPSGLSIESTVTYHIQTYYYVNAVNNIYLYYASSDVYYIYNNDCINIDNQTGASVNFYLVKQDTDATTSTINISRTGTVNFYTNLVAGYIKENGITPVDVKQNEITVEQSENRIYSIQLDLFSYVAGATEDKFKNKLYTLNSNQVE